jgi:hypothetical protein
MSPSSERPGDPLAGDSPELELYRAVRRYVQSGGGSIVVIGGIEVQQWPGDNSGVYRVAVKFMGRKPEFPKGEL